MDHACDVAISFLSRDEPLAVKIHAELSEHLNVFVYSKRQEELAGTDGLETFREVFLSRARLVVVLYRDGWGKTPWTAVEEIAIKDRVFKGGWDSLLFVTLDDKSTPPVWLPLTHLRLNYASYSGDLIGAIKMRAQELGSAFKIETAGGKAKRVQANELVRAERDRVLSKHGGDAVRSERDALRQQLDEKLERIEKDLTTIELRHGSDNHEYLIRTERASLNFCLYVTFPITESRIVVREFDGALILPEDRAHFMFVHGEEPRSISKTNYHFDYDAAHGWCWRQPNGKGNLLTTSDLAEHLIKCVLELHEKFKTGKGVKSRRSQGPDAGQWS